MNTHELGIKLKEMYNTQGMNKVTMIHLFGILYAIEIELSQSKVDEIIKISGLPASYATEVRKGLKLAPLVDAKGKYVEMFK